MGFLCVRVLSGDFVCFGGPIGAHGPGPMGPHKNSKKAGPGGFQCFALLYSIFCVLHYIIYFKKNKNAVYQIRDIHTPRIIYILVITCVV